ncbi:hypothetical protein LOTGIDRAFT_111299 [Lottia gigantea]|uniref:Leucine-rich repeat-containing protein 58 n=1 Tax=Lottia gigantea TaxID=225164 RepID=V4CJ03_LOTGI|nr:hypothetical protein LOTGIDRAFT_111299 [Lottia gigantea]ESP02175.1 hypothetical protein LOTGIDRAFT_111299 [Lottia gigantea]
MFPDFLLLRSNELRALQLDHNEILSLPDTISSFKNLVTLDISANNMTQLSSELVKLHNLKTFIARNNCFDTDSLPKDFGLLRSLEVLHLGGNNFIDMPAQITELPSLRCLYMGGNKISHIGGNIKDFSKLEILYLGGNCLVEIPAEIGYLQKLTALVLCDNQIQSLPPTLIHLQSLRSLSLHNNQISTLPTALVSLNIVELSLRNNPLVVKFVQDLVYNPPTLLELSGRCVKVENLPYSKQELPSNLMQYLDSAKHCVNPKCKGMHPTIILVTLTAHFLSDVFISGVYFSSHVEQVKFVDFCGKYKLPLLQYLCSPSCSTVNPVSESESEDSEDSAKERMRRVLLG